MSWQLSKDVERAFDPAVAIQERRKEAEVLTLLALLVQKCERSTRRWRSKSAARRQRLLTLLALLAQEQRYSIYLLYWYKRARTDAGGGGAGSPRRDPRLHQ
jgi:hypothetical protein